MAWSALVGSVASGTGDISPAPHASHATNDIELLLVESVDDQAATLSVAAGFAAVTSSPVVATGTALQGGTRLTVFWRRWNGSDGTPTVLDPTNHAIGIILSIGGAVTSGDPFDATPTTTSDTSGDTSVSCPAITTATAGALIVCAVSQGLPDSITNSSEFASWTNANLTSLTEQVDLSRADGNGGALGCATGEKASAGDTGATTATATTTSFRASITIALKPEGGAAPANPAKFLPLLGVGIFTPLLLLATPAWAAANEALYIPIFIPPKKS